MRNARHLRSVAPVVIAGGAMLLGACFWRRAEAPPQSAAAQEIVPMVGSGSGAIPITPTTVLPEAPEPYVDLELADAPVRLVLQRLAEIGGLQLVIPANLNKTISVQYVRVPVSVALNDVLRRSGLRLGAGPAANMPFDTVTVFYQLPANIDSLSVEGIMRRFSVSRAMAELIVKSRKP